MKLKDKDRIVGSVAILILGIIFLVTGYFLSKNDNNNSKKVMADEVFIERSMDEKNYEEICTGDDFVGEKVNLKAIEENIDIKDSSYNAASIFNPITVDIKGEVNKPGVYTMEEESRIQELIEQAGGLTEDADTSNLNLAEKLYDEACIYVRKIGEENRLDIPCNNEKNIVDNSMKKTNGSKTEKININTAGIEELKTLPGIGDVLAHNIISYREEHNGFKSVEELTNVSRIGSITLDKFIDMVDIR